MFSNEIEKEKETNKSNLSSGGRLFQIVSEVMLKSRVPKRARERGMVRRLEFDSL
jgi:hypothetical protein